MDAFYFIFMLFVFMPAGNADDTEGRRHFLKEEREQVYIPIAAIGLGKPPLAGIHHHLLLFLYLLGHLQRVPNPHPPQGRAPITTLHQEAKR